MNFKDLKVGDILLLKDLNPSNAFCFRHAAMVSFVDQENNLYKVIHWRGTNDPVAIDESLLPSAELLQKRNIGFECFRLLDEEKAIKTVEILRNWLHWDVSFDADRWSRAKDSAREFFGLTDNISFVEATLSLQDKEAHRKLLEEQFQSNLYSLIKYAARRDISPIRPQLNPGCRLYLLNELPNNQDIESYIDSYIFLQSTKELYYIPRHGNSIKEEIKNIDKLQSNLETLNLEASSKGGYYTLTRPKLQLWLRNDGCMARKMQKGFYCYQGLLLALQLSYLSPYVEAISDQWISTKKSGKRIGSAFCMFATPDVAIKSNFDADVFFDSLPLGLSLNAKNVIGDTWQYALNIDTVNFLNLGDLDSIPAKELQVHENDMEESRLSISQNAMKNSESLLEDVILRDGQLDVLKSRNLSI